MLVRLVLDLYQILMILPRLPQAFSILSLRRIALKIRVDYFFIVFTCSYCPLVFLRSIVALVILCIPEIRTADIGRVRVISLMLAIKGASADNDTQTCCYKFGFAILVYCCYNRPKVWLLYVSLSRMLPGTRIRKRSLKQVTEKKKQVLNLLSFSFKTTITSFKLLRFDPEIFIWDADFCFDWFTNDISIHLFKLEPFGPYHCTSFECYILNSFLTYSYYSLFREQVLV